jgi:HlyD family secretion protein
MKKSRIVIIIVVILILAAAGVYFLKPKKVVSNDKGYEFTPVKRGNIENIVTCTGTLNPISSVDIGTEVSGTIADVLVDFNDVVKKNQVLAILDTTQIAITLRTSKADLIRVQSQYDLAKMTYESDQELFKKGFISAIALQTSKTSFNSAEASLISSQSTYEKNYNNLTKYAIIRSPINGTVINRSVDAGQTVAASFSTPTLFTIAEDLSKMQINALVDESDIGQIKKDMAVVFSVESYPDMEFKGIAKQIRLQPQTVSNVVNYTVVVEADNKSGLLLPGMTATVEFIVEQQTDVLIVQTSALKYQPGREEMMAVFEEMRTNMTPEKKKEFEERRKNGNGGGQRPENGNGMPGRRDTNSKDAGRIWFLNDAGKLTMARVRTGATDGSFTEISGDEVTEGMNVIYKQKIDTTPRYMQRSLF